MEMAELGLDEGPFIMLQVYFRVDMNQDAYYIFQIKLSSAYWLIRDRLSLPLATTADPTVTNLFPFRFISLIKTSKYQKPNETRRIVLDIYNHA